MEVSKIDFCENTDKLRELILQRPELPIVVLTDYEVIGEDYGYWYGQDITFSIEKIIGINKYGQDTTTDDPIEFYEYIENELADIEEYSNLSDEEFDELVKAKVKEYEALWTECIVIRSSV